MGLKKTSGFETLRQLFIQQAEQGANDNEGVHNNNIDTVGEKTIFDGLVKEGYKKGEQSLEDTRNLLLETFDADFSNTTKPVTKPSQARAPKRSTTIFNINIEINISVVVNAINKNDYTDLIAILKQYIDEALEREGGNVEVAIKAYIDALISTLSTNPEVDLSQLESILNGLIERLEKLEDAVTNQAEVLSNLNNTIMNLDTDVRAALQFNYQFAEELGAKIGNLEQLIQNSDRRQMKMLAKIYKAVMQLSNNFTEFTKVSKEQYNNIMRKFGTLDFNDKNILAKLQFLYSMLVKLQKTADGNSGKLDELLSKSNKIIEILENLEIPVPEGYDDTEIKQMLADILANMVTEGDFEQAINEFKAMMEELKTFIANTVGEAKTEILNAISHIKPGDIDLEWLKQILARIEEKIDGVAESQVTIIANQETMLGALGALNDKVDKLDKDVAHVSELATIIKGIVEKLRNCDCEHVDWDALWEKVEQLLEKYRCCCGEDNNEGAIDPQEVEDLISFAREQVYDMIPVPDESTGIKNTQSHKNDNTIHYDLNGRRVDPKKPGVHIVNGKTVVVK